MTSTQKAFRRKPFPILPLAALVAATAVMSGCNSSNTVPASPAGGASGTELALNNPNTSPAYKAQMTQQQQVGQMQNQALEQAHEREMTSGQTQKN